MWLRIKALKLIWWVNDRKMLCERVLVQSALYDSFFPLNNAPPCNNLHPRILQHWKTVLPGNLQFRRESEFSKQNYSRSEGQNRTECCDTVSLPLFGPSASIAVHPRRPPPTRWSRQNSCEGKKGSRLHCWRKDGWPLREALFLRHSIVSLNHWGTKGIGNRVNL